MPSQDLLFPILPRAPAAPSSDDIKREVTQISQKHQLRKTSTDNGDSQGESVNILLNFTQFFETRIEYRFQIFTAHSCDFLLPSYARLA